jgi:hypothetical protein
LKDVFLSIEMPVERGTTTRGGIRVGFYRWGQHGTKYTYKPGSEASRERAYNKAARQGRAIKWSQSR